MKRRFEIEPLSAQRWAKIERNVRERVEQEGPSAPPARPARQSALAFAMVAAAAIVIGGVGWEWLRPIPRAPVSLVSVSRVDTEETGSRVSIGESVLEVGPWSSARVEGDDASGITVTLDRGDVTCDVAPRNGRPPFSVRAGTVTVKVIGTHFHVTRVAGGARVEVDRGTVEVDEGTKSDLVHAGESWPAMVVDAAVAPTPIASAPPTHATASTIPDRKTPVVVETAAPPIESPRDRYERALTLESTSPAEALSIYGALASGEGPWAMNALFAEARLEAERGDKATAKAHLAEYLARYPQGPNASDARELIEKLR
jgi:hypothetical protein